MLTKLSNTLLFLLKKYGNLLQNISHVYSSKNKVVFVASAFKILTKRSLTMSFILNNRSQVFF